MKRRSFIQGFTALSLLGVSGMIYPPKKSVSKPQHVLYGDGKHDDTEALQAWFDGKDVYWANGRIVNNIIKYKEFRITDTLYITEHNFHRNILTHCVIYGDLGNRDYRNFKSFIDQTGNHPLHKNSRITYCHFRDLGFEKQVKERLIEL